MAMFAIFHSAYNSEVFSAMDVALQTKATPLVNALSERMAESYKKYSADPNFPKLPEEIQSQIKKMYKANRAATKCEVI